MVSEAEWLEKKKSAIVRTKEKNENRLVILDEEKTPPEARLLSGTRRTFEESEKESLGVNRKSRPKKKKEGRN